jgi:hypothetical protein
MPEKKQNQMEETETAYTLAMLLMNVLILVIIGAFMWLIYLAVSENRSLSKFLRGEFLH